MLKIVLKFLLKLKLY